MLHASTLIKVATLLTVWQHHISKYIEILHYDCSQYYNLLSWQQSALTKKYIRIAIQNLINLKW